MSGPEFETWLNGMLSDPGDAAVARWLPRLPRLPEDAGTAELLILRETGYSLLRDGSVAATWRLVRLRDLVMLLAMHGTGELAFALRMIWREIEIGGAGPTGTPAQVLNYRGCVLADQERFARAVEHFGAAIDADAGFVPAYLNRARCLLELDRPDEARDNAQAAVARDPRYPQARFTARLVDVLITLADHHPPLFALLAAMHGLLPQLRAYDRPMRPGEYPDVSVWDERAITPLPRPQPSAGPDEWNHVGVIDGRLGRYAEAIEAFRIALDHDPGYIRARFNLAKAYQMAGDHERAIGEVTRLIAEGRPDAEDYRLRARSLRVLWRIEQARADDDAADELEHRRSARSAPPDLPDLSQLLRMMASEPVELAPWPAADVEQALPELERMRLRGQHREGFGMLTRLAQRPAPTPVLRARLREQQAGFLAGLGRYAEAAGQYSAAVDLLDGEAGGPADEVRIRCLRSRAGCYPDPADERREADLHTALFIAIRVRDRLAEGQLRARLADDARSRGRSATAASWYLSAVGPAREAEDWASLVAILSELAGHAARAGRDDEAQAFREERDRARGDAGDLAFLGTAAPGRAGVPPRDEVLGDSRERLLARAPRELLVLTGTAQELTLILDHADRLRREENRPADALICYYSVLPLCVQLTDAQELSGCLTGMGTAFESLAGAAARAALLALHASGDAGLPADGLSLIAATGRALASGEAGELTRCAQAAYRWALEEARRQGDLDRQAMHVSNLAVIEARLGNLDTAARYERWALGVHSRAGLKHRMAVDLGHLMSVAERMGDDDSAAEFGRQREELRADAGT